MNFADLAQVKVGEVERPKPLPEGHYIAQISGPMTQHKAKSGNVAMRFPCKIVGPGEDVDQADLDAAGGIPEKPINLDFWMSPDARFRFTDFAKAQGANDSLNLIECAEYLVGDGNKPFLLKNTPQPSEDNPEIVYNRFDNPTALEG